MSMPAVEERVDRLEDALQRFTETVGREFSRLYESQMRTEAELRAFKGEMRIFKHEMRVFKDEMGVFKDEMGAFKDEMGVFKDEMGAFKDEMGAFKDEMRVFKDESVASRARLEASHFEMNRKWGELSNKLGTLVEDLVAPSLPRVIRETLGREVLRLSERVRLKLPDGESKEYDAIAVTADLVCVNSTKAALRSDDIKEFVRELPDFRAHFPEYADYPLIGILATLAVDDSLVRFAERQGLLVLAIGEQVMEVKNTAGFEPRPF